MSRDPIGYAGSQWNLYEYVVGAPTFGKDPFGLDLVQSGVEFMERQAKQADEERKRRISDPDRIRMIKEAERVGLSDDIRGAIRIVDHIRRHNLPLIEGFWAENVFGKEIIQGPCGRWTRNAADDLKNSRADRNKEIDIRTWMIQRKPDSVGRECQNCIRITFRGEDGELQNWFLDDGQLGGHGGVFDQDKAEAFMDGGKGLMFDTGYQKFDNKFRR